MRIKTQFAGSFVVVMAAFLMLAETASADSFGSWGGSWGSGSSGSRLFGGSNGGPVRNLLARAPLRTMLGRARSRVSGWGSSGGGSFGSRGGGSFGYGSSGGYSTGNASVGSYVSGGSSGGGSWGSSRSYGSSGGGSWGSVANYGSTGSYAVSTPSFGSVMSAPISNGSVAYDSFGMPMETSFGTPVGGAMNGTIMNGGVMDGTITQGGMGEIIDPGYYNGSSAPAGVMGVDGSSVIDGSGAVEPVNPGGALSPPSDGGGVGGGDPMPQPNDDDTTLNQRLKESLIDVTLPEDAIVYVNGKLTKKTGEFRTFVARHQSPNRSYRYEVAAIKDGQKKVETFTMLAGGSKSLNFDFSTMTVVALQVPENAQVELAGNLTTGSGAKRSFTTKKLEEGEIWDDYTVVVTYEKDGEKIVCEKTIDVVGGNAYVLDFASSVDSTSVAVKKP